MSKSIPSSQFDPSFGGRVSLHYLCSPSVTIHYLRSPSAGCCLQLLRLEIDLEIELQFQFQHWLFDQSFLCVRSLRAVPLPSANCCRSPCFQCV